MKTEEQLRKELISKLQAQANRLRINTLESMISYSAVRHDIAILEDVLELNVSKI